MGDPQAKVKALLKLVAQQLLPAWAMVGLVARDCRVTSRLAVCALVLLFAGGDSTARNAESASLSMAGPWDMIALEVKSWGRPVSSWRLLSSGSGTWTETVEPSRSAIIHEVELGAAGFDRVVDELSRLPTPVPDSATCLDFMPDLPYGTLRLTRAATTIEIAWNSGCRDSHYRYLLAALKAADAIVATQGRSGRVLRTEPLEPPPGVGLKAKER